MTIDEIAKELNVKDIPGLKKHLDYFIKYRTQLEKQYGKGSQLVGDELKDFNKVACENLNLTENEFGFFVSFYNNQEQYYQVK